MASIYLVHRRGGPFQFTLYHEEVCRRAKMCTCGVRMRPGQNGKQVVSRQPMSVQVDVGGVSELLPAEVFFVPQVRMALRDGLIERVTFEDWVAKGMDPEQWADPPKPRHEMYKAGPDAGPDADL